MQESRHKLARDICHGKRGQIMQAYREARKTSSVRSGSGLAANRYPLCDLGELLSEAAAGTPAQ